MTSFQPAISSDAVHILERITDAFFALDTDWRFTYINRAGEKMWGRACRDLIGRGVWDVFPEAVGSTFDREFRRAVGEQVTVAFEEFYPPLDAWLEVRLYPSPDGLSVFFQNVNARRAADDYLHASETRFRQMADAIPHIAWTTEPDGSVDYYNQRWHDYSGLTLAQTKDWGWEAVLHPDDLARAGGVWRTAIQAGTVSEVEYRLRRADGEYRWHLGRSVPVHDSAGTLIRWVGTATDIEDRRRAEETQRENEVRFRALADNIAQLAWMADGAGAIFWYNRRWFDYTDTTLEEMRGWGWQAVHHPDYVVGVTEKFAEHVRTGQAWEDTFPLRGRDGVYRWFLSRAFPMRDEEGRVILWCGTNTDVTALREAEAELASAYQREVMLNQVGQAVRETRDPDKIQAVAVRALGEALGVDRAYYSVIDLARDLCSVGQDYHAAGLPSLAGDYRFSDYHADLLALYPAGEALVVSDVSTSAWPEAQMQAIRALRVRAVLSVPLFDDGVLVGALAVAMADEPRTWTDAEISLVKTVAVQTRTVLDAARVQESEHRIAEQLALALQPATPPKISGMELAQFYRPAWEDQGVGGDFSDVFSTDKGVTFLVVADLSGKGLAAAASVAMVRHMLRFALYNGRTVAGPVTNLNTTLADNGLLSGFCTLFVGRYDAEAQTLTYVNCGQDAGLILRAATGTVDTLLPTGPILGAVSGVIYTEKVVALGVNDALALYSDGLSEAGPTRTALLTGDGVADLLRGLTGLTDPREIVRRVMAGVDAHAGLGVRDDQCLLVGVVSRR